MNLNQIRHQTEFYAEENKAVRKKFNVFTMAHTV